MEHLIYQNNLVIQRDMQKPGVFNIIMINIKAYN